jgi:hypothetical protein
MPRGWYWLMVVSYPRYMFRAACGQIIGPLYDPSTGLTGDQYLQLYYDFNATIYNRWMDWGIVFSFYAAVFLAAAVAFVYVNWFAADQSEEPNWHVSEISNHIDINGETHAQAVSNESGMGADTPAKSGPQAELGKAYIQWSDLCYDVMVDDKEGGGGKVEKRLLDHVYGYCAPGMMVALMGASGKWSLHF